MNRTHNTTGTAADTDIPTADVTPADTTRGATTDTADDADWLDAWRDILLDSGGYLACGCHGTQRDHTCGPLG
jgi:hypothetical protein